MFERIKRFMRIRLLHYPDIRKPINDNYRKYEENQVFIDWPVGKEKPFVGLTQDTSENPYWTKYAKFLSTNNFTYEIFSYHKSNWLEQAKRFDLVIWSPVSRPSELDELKHKIYILEKIFKKKCFPDYETLLLCDDRIMLTYYLQMNYLPVAKTFISNDYHEIVSEMDSFEYPLVNKITYGAGSKEISLIKNRNQARKIAKRTFSFYGRKTHIAYYRQKNYVYFQEFVEGERIDTRVNIIGNMIFGYYRKPRKGDFRASGSGIVIKEDLPLDVVEVALKTYQKIGKVMLAVDMLKDENGEYKIIEISPFLGVKTPIQLSVKGKSGAYLLKNDGVLEFKEENYWPQELALKTYFEQNYLSNIEDWKERNITIPLETGKLRKTS